MLGLDPFAGVVLLVAGLATWRITSLLVYEAGPFGVFTRLRAVASTVGLGGVLSCFHCAGLWVAGAVALASFRGTWALLLVVPGLAGFASALEWRIAPARLTEPEEEIDAEAGD